MPTAPRSAAIRAFSAFRWAPTSLGVPSGVPFSTTTIFPRDVEPGIIVEAARRQVETEAGEDQRRLDRQRLGVRARPQQHLAAMGEGRGRRW